MSLARRGHLRQRAVEHFAKRREHRLQVLLGQIRMNARHVDAMMLETFVEYLLDNRLRLRNIERFAHFYVRLGRRGRRVHVLNGDGGRLGHFELNVIFRVY